MIKAKLKIIVASILCSTMCFTSVFSSAAMAATTAATATTTATTPDKTYQDRFMTMWNKIHDSNNGYFKDFAKDGKTLKVPYHSAETMMCEAPDQGHETTSEAYSYYMWLEAMYGKFTGDWSQFKGSWDSAEKFIIPSSTDQPGMGSYNASKPATLANEYPSAKQYPSKMQTGAQVGSDPISNELKNAYGTNDMYGMHWLLDVDNWYGFGNHGNGSDTSAPSYINTFQRGSDESVWETVPQPCWDLFKYGGKNGYLDLFTGDNSYAKQWKYTDAPDADARAIQATYWADKWSNEQGKNVDTYVSKASKMGDYLRYSMFDKYFRNIGTATSSPQNTSEHYLMSWYYAWGGSANADWSWKIGSSHNHFGYQNPMTAWIMSNTSDFKPKSTNGQSDWAKSLDRQLELYQWLQSSEGAIAGGATNSYTTENGSYQSYPAGTSTFYGMAYDPSPVYADPSSNQWFGMQGWSMQRVAELYYQTGNEKAGAILDKWAKWIKSSVKLTNDGSYQIPGDLGWSGQPDKWTGTATKNSDLHVNIKNYTTDIGSSSSLANTLMYYAAGQNKYNKAAFDGSYNGLAKEILDRMWNKYQDDKGVCVPEEKDFSRLFNQEVYIPSGWTGAMPNGDAIKPGVKFIDIRSKYKQDPDYARVKAAEESGTHATMEYHRFWQESEAAIAIGTYSILAPELPVVGGSKGDANGDGEVDILDYIALQNHIIDPTKTVNTENSDMNGDGKINSADLLALRKIIIG
jgi:hypothetical protein